VTFPSLYQFEVDPFPLPEFRHEERATVQETLARLKFLRGIWDLPSNVEWRRENELFEFAEKQSGIILANRNEADRPIAQTGECKADGGCVLELPDDDDEEDTPLVVDGGEA